MRKSAEARLYGKPTVETPGQCPRCGAILEYTGMSEGQDYTRSYPVECGDCGWQGWEIYEEVFGGFEELERAREEAADATA